MSLEELLGKYIISSKTYPHLPRSLDGEVFLKDVRDITGAIIGSATVKLDDLKNIIRMRDNPSLREDITVIFKGERRRLRELTKEEFEEITGYAKIFKKWREEGITI